jgi:hypothetical protein
MSKDPSKSPKPAAKPEKQKSEEKKTAPREPQIPKDFQPGVGRGGIVGYTIKPPGGGEEI